MDQKSVQKREYHLGALLLLAVAFAHCMSLEGHPRSVNVFLDFVQLAAYPALVFLFGRLSRDWINTRERLIRYAMGCGELYLVQKILIYWADASLGEAPSFHIFSAADAPWLYLVLGAYLLLMLAIEGKKWPRRVIFFGSVAVGCLAGLLGWIGDDFCLARMAVCFPLFLMGRWIEASRLNRVLSRPLVKVGGLAGVLAVFALCYVKAHSIHRMSAFLDGNCAYAALPDGLIAQLGPVARLGWYVVVIFLLLALLSLMPNRKLPLLTHLSEAWPLAYLWQRPVTTVFNAALMSVLANRMGKWGYLLGLGIVFVLMILTFLPWAVRPVQWLMRRANFWNPTALPRAQRLTGEGDLRHTRRRQIFLCVLLFTGVFFVLAVAVTLPLFQNGKSMVWQMDGLRQQYTSMVFLRNYIHAAAKDFFSTGILHLNQYTFQAGMGMGVLDVLRRDPLLLLCVFIPMGHMEAMYNVLTMLHIYLGGLAFIWLCWELERTEKREIICAAMTFAFCGYSVYIMIRQPVFQISCLIYLPLMLAGVERFLKKRRDGLFLATVCLNFINGYYLAYVNTLIMATYLLVRLIFLYGRQIRTILTEIGKLIGIYLWGVALSSVILLPTIYSYLTSSRTGDRGGTTSLFSYDQSYYQNLFNELVKGCPDAGESWAILSFTGMTLLSIVLLFLKKDKKYRPLKAGVIICTVMICVPLFGKIMNGFGYVTNRWCYAFALMGALVLVFMLPEFLHLSRRETLILLLAGGVYLGLVISSNREVSGARYVGLLMLAVTLLAVVTLGWATVNEHQKKVVLSLTVSLTLVVNLCTTFLPEIGNYAEECIDAGKVQTELEDDPVSVASKLGDGFYRVEQPANGSNQSMALNYYGTTSYFSVISAELSKMYSDFYMNTETKSFDLQGFDTRAGLESLACVRYYLTDQHRVPYGFQKVGEKRGYGIFENHYALPLGFTYQSYMTQSAYKRLSFAEKQQALLQYAVLPDHAVPKGLVKGTPRLTVKEKTCSIRKTDGLTVNEAKKTISVEKAGGSITFSFGAVPDTETYLYLDGINYADPQCSSVSSIKVKANGTTTNATLRGKKQNYYYAEKGFTFHLGYNKNGTRTCELTFTKTGAYKYRAFRIACLPMKDYVSDVTALGQEGMKDVAENGDRISGNISVTGNRLLTFSIPYSKGWSLYVDGKKTPLLQVDELYMGAPIQAGEHQIVLRYSMPWLKEGAVVSAAALAAILARGLFLVWFRRKPTAQSAKWNSAP